jgi:hypothetical protein
MTALSLAEVHGTLLPGDYIVQLISIRRLCADHFVDDIASFQPAVIIIRIMNYMREIIDFGSSYILSVPLTNTTASASLDAEQANFITPESSPHGRSGRRSPERTPQLFSQDTMQPSLVVCGCFSYITVSTAHATLKDARIIASHMTAIFS